MRWYCRVILPGSFFCVRFLARGLIFVFYESPEFVRVKPHTLNACADSQSLFGSQEGTVRTGANIRLRTKARETITDTSALHMFTISTVFLLYFRGDWYRLFIYRYISPMFEQSVKNSILIFKNYYNFISYYLLINQVFEDEYTINIYRRIYNKFTKTWNDLLIYANNIIFLRFSIRTWDFLRVNCCIQHNFKMYVRKHTNLNCIKEHGNWR